MRPEDGPARADALLVARGLAPSRSAAQRLIEAGRVSWLGTVIGKPAQELPADAELRVMPDEADRYVSRGGLKLAGALDKTGVVAAGRTCLDVGQSTGGFTDCLLQAGATRVVGVDVGHDQLAPRLRADARVECHEGINARELAKSVVAGRRFGLIVADVSFISLTLILPQLPALLADDGDLLLLVKPQFEVGAHNLGKGGVVKDARLYAEVEAKLRACCAENRLAVRAWFDSPIAGGGVGNIAGNREFFIHAKHE